jgi:O-antigen ligase
LSLRLRGAFGAAAVVLPLLLAPLLLQPLLAIGLVVVVLAAFFATRSVAYPMALSAVFALLIALLGRNPFPNGAIAKATFVWIALALVVTLVRGDDTLRLRQMMTAPVLLTVATVAWMVARLPASADTAYGSFKLQLFVAENLTLLVAGVVVGRSRRDFRLFLLLTLAMSALAAVVLARGLATGQTDAIMTGRLALSSDYNPIIFGRDAARAITIAVLLLLVARVAWLRLVALASLPLLAVSFTASGSRGPALGLVVGLVALLALTLREPASRRRVLAVFAGGAAGALLISRLVPSENVSRSLSFLVGNSSDAYSNGRTELWDLAWQSFASHPLAGLGTGGFGDVDPNNLYPHNLLLETAAELGIVGLVLVAATIAVGASRALRTWSRSDAADKPDVAVAFSFLVAAAVNAMFSGDIAVNNGVWLAVGLATGIQLRPSAPAALPALGRLRGRTGKPPRPPRDERPERRRSESEPGWIVAPEDGRTVVGDVDVVVRLPPLARPVAEVRLEWAGVADGWTTVAVQDERTFDLVVGDRPAAVVRSRSLAGLVAEALGARVEPSRRRPWSVGADVAVAWDTSGLPAGAGRLRAVTVDVGGAEAPTPAVELVVVPSVRDAPPPQVLEPLYVQPPEGPLTGVAELTVSGGAAAALELEGDDGWRAIAEDARLDTTALPDGRHRLRARAAGRVSDPVDVVVDNHPPRVVVTAPRAGAVVSGVVELRADAYDMGTGVASVLFQRSQDGSTWRTIPGTHWDTSRDEDGAWSVRAVAVDRARHPATSPPVAVELRNAVAPPPPAPAPAPTPAPAAADGRPTIFALTELVDAADGLDRDHEEVLRTMLEALRDYADLDGRIPPRFDGLIEDEFGFLLGGTR